MLYSWLQAAGKKRLNGQGAQAACKLDSESPYPSSPVPRHRFRVQFLPGQRIFSACPSNLGPSDVGWQQLLPDAQEWARLLDFLDRRTLVRRLYRLQVHTIAGTGTAGDPLEPARSYSSQYGRVLKQRSENQMATSACLT